MATQQPPTITAPRTEPEKGGSVNRSGTSSLPPTVCILTPALLYALSLTPFHTVTPTPFLPGYHLLQGAKKTRDVETPAGLQNVQNLLLLNPQSSSIYLRPRNTMQKLQTKLKMESKVADDCESPKFETQMARRSTGSRF